MDAGADASLLSAPLPGDCESVQCPPATRCVEGACVEEVTADGGAGGHGDGADTEDEGDTDGDGEADGDGNEGADGDGDGQGGGAADDDGEGGGDADADDDDDDDDSGDADVDGDRDGDAGGGGDADVDGDDDGGDDPDGDGDGADGGGETCDDPAPFRFRVLLEGDTRDHGNDLDNDCAISWGPDVVYSFVAESSGAAFFQVTAGADDDGNRWDTTLYLRADCGDGDLACNDDIDADGDGSADIGWSAIGACVEEGRTYHVVVDGYWADSAGPFALVGDLEECGDCDGGVCGG